eukprot:NODE_58_length_28395_cov_1.465720.p21 type:complete len:174 gc:universal NODE_58_length_28395_cov_1.465720:23046-22525(-)
MIAYEFLNSDEPFTMPHKGEDVSMDHLTALGIKCKKFEMTPDVVNEMINEYLDIYPAHDIVHLTDKTPKEMMNKFFEEHLHEDAEIRFIIEGKGYFDVRDVKSGDKWIRIMVEKGDFIIIPAGIYHRFTIDENLYIKALRLFELNPKWIPHNRSPDSENLPIRKQYLKELEQK